MGTKTEHAWRSLRVAQIPTLLRRMIGLTKRDDPAYNLLLNTDDIARLQTQSRAARGPNPQPAIFVHGVLPRSGTNFAANLLALHPSVAPYPRQLYELPLLATADGSIAWFHEFLVRFPANEAAIQPVEPLTWTANGMMRVLQAEAGDRHMLFKSPHMRHIGLFDAVFPDDMLVFIVRDGRDVIASSQKTFRGQFLAKNRRQLTSEWCQATEAALRVRDERPGRTILWRYEDLVADAEAILRRDLPTLGLDPATFPYNRLSDFPVFGSSNNETAGREKWLAVPKNEEFRPIGRWRDWTTSQQQAFLRHAGETMRKMGYG